MNARVSSLLDRLDGCMLADASRLRRRIRGKRPAHRGGPRGRPRAAQTDAGPSPAELERIARDIERSRERAETRLRAAPEPTYPDELPVSQRRDEIARAIRDHQVVVVCGETGSGKTTQLPKICLELGRGVRGMIGHTQPRRIAARSVAARIASELKADLGKAVGYKVRFGDQTSPDTYVKLMTDGILLAETQGDRRLLQYDTLIIDEAHERSLNIDFLLGYLRSLLPKRPDLKIVITSATIDPERFAEHFADARGAPAPIINVSGRTYPVDVRYRPPASDDPDAADLTMEEAVLEAVDECAREDARRGGGAGDILVFLPGEREIREIDEALRKHHPPQTEVLPLFARLSAAEQQRVFKAHGGRRIVLATNVAETSLTVPGIRYVVDTGVARISRYSARQRVQRLPVEKISRASADQRMGRCGRVGPGVCFRLYAEQDFLSRPEFTDPEIVRTNLASVILQMKALKLGDVSDFGFIDPPDDRLVKDGYETLHELGAVDSDGALTDLGRDLARLPIDPTLGRMLLAAEKEDSLAEMLVIAAALSIQDPRERPMDKRDQADAAHEQWADENSDFDALLNLWAWWNERRRKLSGSKLRKACAQNFLSYMRMREWADTHQQLKRLVTEMGHKPNDKPADYDDVHRALLVGLIRNIGRLKDPPEYQGARGQRFYIFPGSGLFRNKPKWVMAGELVRTTRLYARNAARIDPAWVERGAPHLVKHRHGDPRWDPRSGRPVCNETVTLFGLEIIPRRTVAYGPVNREHARQLFIHHALVEMEWQTRADFFKHNADLIARVRDLENKGRRRNLLADAHRRYAFFDQRLPKSVVDGATFDKWRKRAEAEDPGLLRMSDADVLEGDASDITADNFPADRAVGDERVPLAYRYEPGRKDDGVTITLPIDRLAELGEEEAEWLVPGMTSEKVRALIRALPKDARRRFAPAGEIADRVARSLDPERERSFKQAVARELGRVGGCTIDPAVWRGLRLPEHLSMNVRVLGDDGRPVAEGRDLGAIRRELGAAIARRLRTLPSDDYTADGLTEWPADGPIATLPERIEIARLNKPVPGFPALVDESGEGVGCRVFAERASAVASHRAGVRRLAELELGDHIRRSLDEFADVARLAVLYAPVGDARSLRRAMARAVADRAVIGDRTPPRSRDDFERALDHGWNHITPEITRLAELLDQILTERHRVDLALSKDAPAAWRPALEDVRRQLARLMHETFITETPHRWLAQLPRYLRAVQRRLEKLRGGGHEAVARDARLAETVAGWRRAHDHRRANHHEMGLVDPETDHLFWMIEEYAVSLFAQDLGVVVKVSHQRLEKQWYKGRE